MSARLKILLLLGVVVLPGTAIDFTIENHVVGTDVVLATISKLESAQIFPSDKRLLRRIAYVETDDGQQAPPSSDYGGIWNVDRASFTRTTNDSSIAVKLSEIAEAFPEVGDWEEVVWNDMTKPLWSALAARLVLFIAENVTEIPSASDISGQAQFWKHFYNEDGDMGEFESRVASLIEEEGCMIKADILFLMDSSGSVKRRNFRKMKRFVSNYVDSLAVSPNSTQVGVIVFNDTAWVAFHLNTFSTKSSLLTEIDDIPYHKGYTNTADALCLMLEEGFSEPNGARLTEDEVISLAVVITDGESNRNSSRCNNATTHEVIEMVHESPHSITLFAVGITDEVNEQELLAIASKEDYYTFMEDFVDSEFIETRDEQLYDLCTKATKTVDTARSLSGVLEEGGIVRYEFSITTQDLVFDVCISQGQVQLYGSYTVPNPNSALNDLSLSLNSSSLCSNITIDGNTVDSNETTPLHDSFFVLLEGTEALNAFNIIVPATEVPIDNQDINRGSSSDEGSGEHDVQVPRYDGGCIFLLPCILIVIITVIVIGVVLGMCSMCLILLFYRRKRRRKRKKLNQVGVVTNDPSIEKHQL